MDWDRPGSQFRNRAGGNYSPARPSSKKGHLKREWASSQDTKSRSAPTVVWGASMEGVRQLQRARFRIGGKPDGGSHGRVWGSVGRGRGGGRDGGGGHMGGCGRGRPGPLAAIGALQDGAQASVERHLRRQRWPRRDLSLRLPPSHHLQRGSDC